MFGSLLKVGAQLLVCPRFDVALKRHGNHGISQRSGDVERRVRPPMPRRTHSWPGGGMAAVPEGQRNKLQLARLQNLGNKAKGGRSVACIVLQRATPC